MDAVRRGNHSTPALASSSVEGERQRCVAKELPEAVVAAEGDHSAPTPVPRRAGPFLVIYRGTKGQAQEARHRREGHAQCFLDVEYESFERANAHYDMRTAGLSYPTQRT
eukprot:gene959-6044_t